MLTFIPKFVWYIIGLFAIGLIGGILFKSCQKQPIPTAAQQQQEQVETAEDIAVQKALDEYERKERQKHETADLQNRKALAFKDSLIQVLQGRSRDVRVVYAANPTADNCKAVVSSQDKTIKGYQSKDSTSAKTIKNLDDLLASLNGTMRRKDTAYASMSQRAFKAQSDLQNSTEALAKAKRPVRIAIGPSVGATLDADMKVKPTAGVSVMYPLIRIK